MKRLLLLLFLGASGCADFPRDPEGTLDRVRATGSFSVGIVSSGRPAAEAGPERAMILAVARNSGARAAIVNGSAEPLLMQLEKGELDFVIGQFSASSPWRSQVHMLPPLASRRDRTGRTELNAAARNGENGWIALLHRSARAAGASP